MKKIISFIMCICILSSFSVVYAGEPVKITLNGEIVESDVEPFIENNRTMVPARAIFESMGAQVFWDDETNTVLMYREKNGESTSIVLQIGLDKAFINNNQVELETQAKIVGNRTFVPLRFIIEAFDENITWDDVTRTVSIVTE